MQLYSSLGNALMSPRRHCNRLEQIERFVREIGSLIGLTLASQRKLDTVLVTVTDPQSIKNMSYIKYIYIYI